MLTYDNTNQAEKQGEKLDREMASKWGPKKRRTFILADSLDRLGYESKAKRARECGEVVTFALQPDGSGNLHQVWFCRGRLCPMCNWRRSLKIYAQTSDIMDVLAKRNYRYIFLTLTVRNCVSEDLKGTVDKIIKAIGKLARRAAWKKSVKGAMYAIEITRNPVDGSWHPHVHMILAVPPRYFAGNSDLYITQKRWGELWQGCCGLDYEPRVDVRTVKGKDSDREEGCTPIGRVVAELSKYATKDKDLLGADPRINEAGEVMNYDDVYPDELIDENVKTVLEAITRRKLVGWIGCFDEARHELLQDDPEEGDLIHIDQDSMRTDVAEIFITYRWRCGIYVRE